MSVDNRGASPRIDRFSQRTVSSWLEIRATGPAAAAARNPEILVVFSPAIQDLSCSSVVTRIAQGAEHIALRLLWRDPHFYGRTRFDSCGFSPFHRGVEALRPRCRRPCPRNSLTISIQRQAARNGAPAFVFEGERASNLKRSAARNVSLRFPRGQ